MGFKGILTVLLLLLSSNAHSESSTLKIAFGNTLPPWVLPETNNGILLDLTRASLQGSDYQFTPVYYPYARRIKAYKNGQVDVVTDITPQVVAKEKLQGYLSSLFYYYENVAISLSENNLQIKELNDLSLLSILAWQGASKTLSIEYAQMAHQNPHYKETHNQEAQIEMLFKNRTQVIQLDTEIFKYYRAQVSSKGEINTDLAVDYAPIFGRNYCGFLFKSKQARDSFDAQFAKFKQQEKQYNLIYSHYVKLPSD